jgi:hypothetical protein
MKKYSLTLIIAIIFTITGCATQDHKYSADGGCLTCFNNPFTGEPINHDGAASNGENPSTEKVAQTQTNAIYKKHQMKLDVPVNVDVAFIKVKREFNFNSVEEVRKKWGRHAEYRLQSEQYKWYALPSVKYSMGSDTKIDSHDIDILIDIDKKTDQSSEITINYWLSDASSNAKKIENTLKNRVIKALN